jgi:hypothetical protein
VKQEDRKQIVGEMMREVVQAVRSDVNALSDFRLLAMSSHSDPVLDEWIARFAKTANTSIASLSTLLREMDAQGLTHRDMQDDEQEAK